jgi:UDP-N-acetylmuramate dehydrogenase
MFTSLSNSSVVDLTHYNSFHVKASADALFELNQSEQLAELPVLLGQYPETLFLGGGSNVLFVEHYPGLVIRVGLKGLRYHDESKDSILVTAMAGENWHDLVMKTLDDGFSGLENLALIPGTVGAAPIQNIGAYGVELADRLVAVEVISLSDGRRYRLTRDECRFAYRDSIFKQQIGQFLITSVTLKLDKRLNPILSYAPLNQLFAGCNPTALEIANAVIQIRRQKLPDPQQLGNAGSFFKNPVVSQSQFIELQHRFPDIIGYPAIANSVKLAAGWLIDQLGLKGYRVGDAGIHQQQALVLVNHGQASGRDIYNLAKYVQKQVEQAYGVSLIPEVRLVGVAG